MPDVTTGLLSQALDEGTRTAAAHLLTVRLHVRPTNAAELITKHVLPLLRKTGRQQMNGEAPAAESQQVRGLQRVPMLLIHDQVMMKPPP